MLKRAFHLTLDVLLKVAAALVGAVIIASFLGFKIYIVQSGSMEPVIKTGSLVVVNENARYDDVKVGDIVAFKTATGTRVTHRVISITSEGFETMGDNNNGLSDGVSTTRANFWGSTYEFCIPGLGYAMAGLNNGNNRLIVIMVVIALILLDLLLDTSDETPKKQKETIEVEVTGTAEGPDADTVQVEACNVETTEALSTEQK